MSQNTILLIQSLLIFSQVLNVGLTGLSANTKVVLAASVGVLQFLAQHYGNQSVGPQVAAMLTPDQMAMLPGAQKKDPGDMMLVPKATPPSIEDKK